jgi:hypothetical protein
MADKLKSYAPHFTGPVTMEESVRMQLEVIDRVWLGYNAGTDRHEKYPVRSSKRCVVLGHEKVGRGLMS